MDLIIALGCILFFGAAIWLWYLSRAQMLDLPLLLTSVPLPALYTPSPSRPRKPMKPVESTGPVE